MLKKIELRILVELGRSTEGLKGFSLYRRTQIPLGAFSEALSSLKKAELIMEIDKDTYRITTLGVKRMALISPILDSSPKPWRNVPERFLGLKINAKEMYVPRISKLDNEILND